MAIHFCHFLCYFLLLLTHLSALAQDETDTTESDIDMTTLSPTENGVDSDEIVHHEVEVVQQRPREPRNETNEHLIEQPKNENSTREARHYQNESSREQQIHSGISSFFDFRQLYSFIPKSIGKGSWTPIKVWEGNQNKISAERVVLSSASYLNLHNTYCIIVLFSALYMLLL